MKLFLPMPPCRKGRWWLTALRRGLPVAAMTLCAVAAMAQVKGSDPSKRFAPSRSVESDVPYGYERVGTTDLYARQEWTIDIYGAFGDYYYSSTFSDGGYHAALCVSNSDGEQYYGEVDCRGSELLGVQFSASVEQQSELARITYTLRNTTDSSATISLGTYADVMIGYNDSAPISRRIDTGGATYGLTMMDGEGAQLCVLFGSGIAGVTSVDDFWFGNYGYNSGAWQIVGNYDQSGNWMVENGSYDSAMGWCWKDRTIAAGEIQTFSILMGIGDVTLEPNSSFEVTPDDPDGWNNVSLPHRLTINGTYESPAGIQGRIEFSSEDTDQWEAITDMLTSGSEFEATLVANFDTSKADHYIRFRIVDAVGNTTVLQPIVYKDMAYYEVTGIQDLPYSYGEPVVQSSLSCSIPADEYAVAYSNNVNAGVATMRAEGLFPYTIGTRSYTFQVTQLPLPGGIQLAETQLVYDGSDQYPEWTFTDPRNQSLYPNQGYIATYTDNWLPGIATVTVQGINNFTGELQAQFYIDKAPFPAESVSIEYDGDDITYDGEQHPIRLTGPWGIGEAIIEYTKDGSAFAGVPCEPGQYVAYWLGVEDGTCYYGISYDRNYSATEFSIYQFDANDWLAVCALSQELSAMGCDLQWDLTRGAAGASAISEISIEGGRAVSLNLSNRGLKGEVPTSVYAFTALKRLDLSFNQPTGNVGAIGYALSNLQSLNVYSNCFADLYPALPASITEVNLSSQAIDKVMAIDLSNLDPTAIASGIPTIVAYNPETRDYNTTMAGVTFRCSSPTEDWGIGFSYNGQLSLWLESAPTDYHGASGDKLDVDIYTDNANNTGHQMQMALSFVMGDANFTGDIDVLDLQAIIAHIFEMYQGMPFNFTAANLWEDSVVNVQDAVCLVNLLCDNIPETTALRVAAENGTEASSLCYIADGQLMISAAEPVAAFDILIDNANALAVSDALESIGFVVKQATRGNRTRLIGYSLSMATLPVGITPIASLQSGSVADCTLANQQAQAVTESAGIMGISSIGTSAAALRINGGKLALPAGLKDVRLQAYTVDGRLIADRTIADTSVETSIDLRIAHGTVAIIRLTAKGIAPITTKIYSE